MRGNDRRQFLANVGSGMLVGSLGAGLAADLGITSAYADGVDDRLTFGELEPLVSLMQETPLDRLQPALLQHLKPRDRPLNLDRRRLTGQCPHIRRA
jgi:hypothetical protein